MFVFIKKVFHIGLLFLSSLLSVIPLRYISMNNQACKVRPEIINLNSNEPVFYSFGINPHMHKLGPRGPTYYIFGD